MSYFLSFYLLFLFFFIRKEREENRSLTKPLAVRPYTSARDLALGVVRGL